MSQKPLTKPAVQVLPYAWVILAVVYLASVAAPLNQFKVPPIMPVLMQELGIDLAQAGSLMPVIALVGWVAAGYVLIPVCLLGFASAWLVRVR